MEEYALYGKNANGRTAEVGTKRANGFQLHDLSGNVWEWVEDCWHEDYNSAPSDGSAWGVMHGDDCGLRVIRGGSWFYKPEFLRASNRYWSNADYRDYNIGFRLAQDIP